MAVYTTCVHYIRCAQSDIDKINRINTIIEALEDAELNAAIDSGDVDEYSFDDGQTKIKAVIRNPKDIEAAIFALEKRKTRLENKCLGRRYNLQDARVKNC